MSCRLRLSGSIGIASLLPYVTYAASLLPLLYSHPFLLRVSWSLLHPRWQLVTARILQGGRICRLVAGSTRYSWHTRACGAFAHPHAHKRAAWHPLAHGRAHPGPRAHPRHDADARTRAQGGHTRTRAPARARANTRGPTRARAHASTCPHTRVTRVHARTRALARVTRAGAHTNARDHPRPSDHSCSRGAARRHPQRALASTRAHARTQPARAPAAGRRP